MKMSPRSLLDRLGHLALALAFACALLPLPAAAEPAEESPATVEADETTEPEAEPAATEGSATPAPAAASPIVILHTNDVHCGVDQVLDANGNPTSIGYAGVSAALKAAKAQYGDDNVTLVDAGDAVQGKPMGTLSQGAYLVDIMNQVGYDLAIPGNHEFDYGMAQLRALVGRSNATYLACNFDNLATGKTEFSPYTIKTYGTTKVAYVGIATPESLTKSNPAHFKDKNGNTVYSFCEDDSGQALYTRVQQTVDAARAAGADYVVALGHLGETGVATRWRADTVIANTTGIDVFIDGHSHEQYEQRIANKSGQEVPLAQTGTQLQTYGQVVIDPATGSITTSLVKPPVAQDADTAAFVKQIEDELNKTLGKVVARTEVKLVAVENDARKNWAVRMHETNLGDLTADAMRVALGADIGFSNGGGIRSDVPVGDITYGNAIGVLPFGNALCKVEASGQTIIDALEMGARLYPQPNGGFLQTSGLTYEIRSDIPTPVKLNAKNEFVGIEGERRVQNVRVNGEPIDLGRTYTVSAIAYLLKDGGDGFTMFKNAKVIVAEQGLDYEALITYIQDNLHGVIAADSIYANEGGEGRILVKNGPDPKPVPKPDPKPEPTPAPNPKPLAPTGDPLTAQTALAGAAALCALAGAVGARRAMRRARPTASRR
ncbi:bifunctional metallophosphatase/5'-nucleotidase [Arabiibacter massiliensis]|uniref:bifunctional metallophosphatase/5'-nucleotidase n=1 Tax=Arabiibacter massiliensis TaxID=1870985 RepID=UPI000B42699C|nr:bifunctional UDP-sugar hydrolase/5'-nucleotidase [Arabiibacter massiliensis]